ncbi:hypothetical protein Lal_00012100 [Lupinus albus]|nr:hypothetical protein Lal_00012100 [Lupinus albus]
MEMVSWGNVDHTILQKILILLICTCLFWKIIRYMCGLLYRESEPVTVLVTGQIGYALVPMIARGVMLGPNQPVILHMLDIEPAADSLKGVKMELIDAAFPLLRGMLFQIYYHLSTYTA